MSENMERFLIAVASGLLVLVATKVWERWQNAIQYIEYLVTRRKDGSIQVSVYNRTKKDYSDVELDVYFRDKADPSREVTPLGVKIVDDFKIVDESKKAAAGGSRLGLFLKVINRNRLKPLLSMVFAIEGVEEVDCILNVIKIGISSRRVEPIALVPVRRTIMTSEAVTVGIALGLGTLALFGGNFIEPDLVADDKGMDQKKDSIDQIMPVYIKPTITMQRPNDKVVKPRDTLKQLPPDLARRDTVANQKITHLMNEVLTKYNTAVIEDKSSGVVLTVSDLPIDAFIPKDGVEMFTKKFFKIDSVDYDGVYRVFIERGWQVKEVAAVPNEVKKNKDKDIL